MHFKSCYPAKAHDFHYTNCMLPRKIASLLHKEPQLISTAVEAFYYRDPIDIRACRNMKTFTIEDPVLYPVKMTKCLYAQLQRQSFQCPPPFKSWAVLSSSPQFKAFDLGMKISCGFEIFYANSAKYLRTGSQTAPDLQLVRQQPGWDEYNRKLLEFGYYRSEIEGSKLYSELEHKALEYFANLQSDSRLPESRSASIVRKVAALLESGSLLKDHDIVKREDDSDDWMYVDAEELESKMSQSEAVFQQELSGTKPKKSNSQSNTEGDKAEAKIFQDIVQGFQTFLKTESTHKGAEIPTAKEENRDPLDVNMERLVRVLEQLGEVANEGASEDEDDEDANGDPLYDDIDAFMENHDEDASNDSAGEDADEEIRFRDYMNAMEAELSRKIIPSETMDPKTKDEKTSRGKDRGAAENEDLGFKPVDVDLNLVKNILESFRAQAGLSGPASALFGSMGIQLPEDLDDLQS
eukprot:TRINITY_DN2229_c0_g1_i6.p1 TRINITY_DN2229_c0_g1~~TRINITY_DN2229_c0_g1_i6.p1  ORF type:complete len:466 (-),score=130.67 TRINITY_DN2229_c0_g1_i6:169-1566(-)